MKSIFYVDFPHSYEKNGESLVFLGQGASDLLLIPAGCTVANAYVRVWLRYE
jgi:hypothetical protein